jgi:hypothetical protein
MNRKQATSSGSISTRLSAASRPAVLLAELRAKLALLTGIN